MKATDCRTGGQMRIRPTHKHDCAKCVFITATHSDHGETYDWYICGTRNPTIIGRMGSDGPSYWSMNVSTLAANLSKPSYITSEDRYAWSERMQLAYLVYSWWRTDPHMGNSDD